MQVRTISTQKWKPPATDWIKINVDSTFFNGVAFSGCIIRNHNGSILQAYSQKHQCLDSLVAECLAVLDGCALAMQLNAKKVVFEADCLNAITLINGVSLNTFWPADPVVERIKRAWKSWPLWSFSFTHRGNNCAAHNLAFCSSLKNFVGFYPLNSIPLNVFCDGGYPIVDSF
ncbi:hypothetical protein CASFOL_038966 [Castilleja foliolosa]|uniref:RNase H type-1 domain-containing protein n=1 Tax=Castilleja foliolosa TaxID=1961234 RepID=A0ABD3BIY7_9LAMI